MSDEAPKQLDYGPSCDLKDGAAVRVLDPRDGSFTDFAISCGPVETIEAIWLNDVRLDP